MTYVSGQNKTGAIYEYKTKLAMGHHSYYFRAASSAATNNYTRLPSSGYFSGPLVTISGLGLIWGKVNPSSGYINTIFNYTVTLANSNGTPNSSLVYIDGKPFSMKPVSRHDVSFAGYYYNTNLSYGKHNFSFVFTVGNKTLYWPAQGIGDGPYVYSVMTQYCKGNVTPTKGNISTTFTYILTYDSSTGGGNGISDYKVIIDGVSHNMTWVSGDNYTKGRYEYKTKLGIGNHNYYFTAKIGGILGRLPVTRSYEGPKVIDEVPRLFNGAVTPTVGYENSTFEFTVYYADPEGKSPTTAEVYVNGSYHDMTYVSGSNKTGAKYSFKMPLLAGNYQFRFNFSDGKNNVKLPSQGYYPGPTVSKPGQPLNYPPVLFNGTVTPQTGNSSTNFVYTVYYKDLNGDSPKLKYVYIDGKAYNMVEVEGNYLTGKKYEYNTTLSAGTHTYYFYFTDVNNSVGRLPKTGSFYGPKVLPPPNKPPVLFNGTVMPASGNTSTQFTYRIHYKDTEGDKPTVKRVYIDNVPFTMYLTNYANFKTGAIYEYKTYLSAGNHTYYFMFNDSTHTVRLPDSGVLYGPSVIQKPDVNNTAPYLYYGRVYPQKGTPKTTFTYYVYYYDAENDTPTAHHVAIDGVLYEMKLVTSWNYPSTGARGLYTYSTKLPVGNHTYYFVFSDGKATTRLPKTGNYSGPIVTITPPNEPPRLYYGRVTPYKGYTTTEFVYTVIYYDLEGDKPTTNMVYIDGVPHTMTFVSGNYKTGAKFEYRTKLSVGKHIYHFLFSDGTNTVRLPSSGTYYGPVVIKPNHPPVADAGPDQEDEVGPPRTIYFDGSNSSDPNMDQLTYFWDFGDGGYAYGEKVSHVFHGVGTYNVTLRVSDGRLKDEDNCAVKITDSGQHKSQGKAPKKSAKIDDGSGFMYTALAASMASTAIIAGVVIAGTEWGLYALLVLLFPLYVRIKGQKILDNFTRGKIYGYIIANPGDNYNSIKTALKMNNGALAHHLHALEREEMIKSQTDGKYKRFYPFEMAVPKRSTQLTTIRKNIVEQIKDDPGITQMKISQKMGVSHQAISYHLRALVQIGAVNVEKKGRANRCYPGDFNGGSLDFEDDEQEWTSN
jgi:predicted transcriptional regulator